MATTKIGCKLSAGFTLVELMIVIVIMAVLTLIIYPSYANNTRKAKRSDAYCNSYTEQFGGAISADASETRCSGLGLNAGNAEAINSELDLYSLKITCAENCMTYQIDAIAQGSQLKDTNCKTFTYSSRGAKTSTDASSQDSTETCWR